MNRFRTNTPRIAGYFDHANSPSDADSLVNLSIMLVNYSGVSVKNIEFDGYNDVYAHPDSLLPHHVTIRITVNGSNTTIDHCEFKNMGRSLNLSLNQSAYQHEAIICSHTGGTAINNVQILNNLFLDNPLDTSHGHEIYLTKNSNAKIKYNAIYNNGEGVPIRFSNNCTNAEVEYNYILGAAEHGYIHDWNSSTMSVSSGIKVNNNVFSDSTFSGVPVNGAEISDNYKGPFISSGESPNDFSGYITEFTGNYIRSDATDDNYLHGVAADSDSLFLASYDSDEVSDVDRIYLFPHPGGPIFKQNQGKTVWGFRCFGEMCLTNDKIITAGVNNNGQYCLGVCDKVNSGDASNIIDNSTTPITALCSTNYTDKFLTAVIENSIAKIYLSSESDMTYSATPVWQCAGLDSISAMTHNGSNGISFVGRSGTNAIYYFGDLEISPWRIDVSDSTSTGLATINVPAMAYTGSSLISVKETSNYTYFYSGSSSTPYTTSLCDSVLTSSKKVLSMDANSSYLYTVLSNSGSDYNRKLFFTDDTTEPFKDILFFSHWWDDDFEQ
ncbi:MAG: right-handed parallel beta-helix repeat-containing protein [Candidatus Latescibacteria bacterium]|nr:right-handed parallel beta-helix repeat-containing protein [Candidatus Latescibacterota bacterium]